MYMSGTVDDYAKAEGLSNRAYISRVLDDMRAMGINTVHPNNLNFDDLPLWIELCRERGMRLIPEGGQFMRDYYNWNPKDQAHFGAPTVEEARRLFRERMIPHYRMLAERYREDRTLLAWNVTEEISLDEPWIFEDLRTLIDDYRQRDPHHPVFVEYHWADMASSGTARTRPELVTAGFGLPEEPFHDFVDWLEVWIEQVAQAARKVGARFYLVPSSTYVYKVEKGRWVPKGHFPTPEDIGLQVWLGYANGAQGMDFWWYHDYTEHQDDGSILRFRGVRDLDPAKMPDWEARARRGIRGARVKGKTKTPMWEAIARIARQIAPLAPWLPRLRLVEGNGGIPYARDGNWVRARRLEDPATEEQFLLAVNKHATETLPLGLELPGRALRLPERVPVNPATMKIPPASGVLLLLPARP